MQQHNTFSAKKPLFYAGLFSKFPFMFLTFLLSFPIF